MFGVAATGGKVERRTARRLSVWTRGYLREVALVDLGCAVAGVFVAAQLRFGNNVTSMYLDRKSTRLNSSHLARSRKPNKHPNGNLAAPKTHPLQADPWRERARPPARDRPASAKRLLPRLTGTRPR